MAITLNLYPKLNEEILSRTAYQATDYKFSYSDNDEQFELESEKSDPESSQCSNMNISDKRGMFNLSDHNLIIERSMTIPNTSFLFGRNGIAGKNAEIGIALIWISKDSNKRGVKKIGSFTAESESYDLDYKLNFNPGSLAGTVNLETVMYLKSPNRILKFEKHMANESGMLLGCLDAHDIVLEGKGSVFPIVEVEQPSSPLWWINMDWQDVLSDEFSDENVKIVLNKGHKNYSDLKLEDGINDSPLFAEILSSALQNLILEVKEDPDWEDIQLGTGFEPGSIAEAVYYFITTFEWDYSSVEKLSFTIRKDLYNRL